MFKPSTMRYTKYSWLVAATEDIVDDTVTVVHMQWT